MNFIKYLINKDEIIFAAFKKKKKKVIIDEIVKVRNYFVSKAIL